MGVHDWYRNESWNTEIESAFELRLKKSRGAFHKVQYLRIQGVTLLSTDNSNFKAIGARLLERVIKEFPEERSNVVSAIETLADYYSLFDVQKAETYYRIVLEAYAVTRNMTSWVADLKLVKLILDTKQTAKYDEAKELLIAFPCDTLSFNSQKFDYYELGAIFFDEIGDYVAAIAYAQKALELSLITEPELSRHKTVGLVTISPMQLDRLNKIIMR